MAYRKPIDLDGFINLMPKADMRVKAILAEDLVTYLSDETNSIVCQDLGLLIDGLIPWLTGSHFKIAQKSLEAFTELIKRLGPDFNAYTATVLPHVIDRLGDSKDTVREKAQLLLHNLMESKVSTPQNLIDKLTICFKHKNAKVREEFLQTIVNTLNEYGTAQLSLKGYIQPIVNLLGDPTATVRDAAIQTLVEIYKHVGDRLRVDLRKKEVPPMKLAILEQKFEEIREEGLLLKSALNHNGQDELDATAPQRPTRLVKRTISATMRKPQSLDVTTASGTDVGSVTPEIFEASFENVPTITIFTNRDIEELFKQITIQISDKNIDWEKRVDALKKIRSLLIMNVQSQPTFPAYLKDLSRAFLDILTELRSQVIREACITLAYMAKILRNKLDQFCIYILQELINLVPNAAKVISSAAIITLKYIMKYTHAPKLIPILTSNLMQSKSKDIRATICELMILIFDEWQTKCIERSIVLLKDALKKGINDADNDARKYSRRAFWSFKKHFPSDADNLYMSLDLTSQKQLDRERDILSGGNGSGSMSASLRGSNTSLNSMPGTVIKRRTSTGLRSPATANPSATSISTENLSSGGTKLNRVPSLPRSYNRNRSGIPVAQRELPVRAGLRSISAVDTAAAQRARARAQYSNLARMKMTSGTASLQGHFAQQARAKKISTTSSSNTATPQHSSPEHRPAVVPRSRAGVSQSQPTSRSTSPSSKLREMYGSFSSYRPTGTVPKKSSGIPRSLANSRETSPTRGPFNRKLYANSPRRPDRPPINPARPVLAQKILQQSREAETALADALSPEDADLSSDYSRLSLGRKLSREESDESEASSVCSERSFDSRRGHDNYSWNGSRNRLDSFRAPIEDIDLIIQYCASTHWAERKDGLISLTQYLSDGKTLTPTQLQCVLDMFRKMFMDTHTKVYALFLDTVNELILAHSHDLHNWLFILLTRLFNKLGTELLGSMHGKIWKTLQLVHEYFPTELQMHCVFRILVDAAQTPSTKTRIATLKFLTNLATTYCSASDFTNEGPAEKAISKIVQLSIDQKSAELRAQARYCLIALYNCNTPNMTMMMSELPKNYQDTARSIIQQHLKRSTSVFTRIFLLRRIGPRSRQSSVEITENLNSEEVYKRLRKTTAEIQNYSFEAKLDRDTNSKDSGISQMGDHIVTTTANINLGINANSNLLHGESHLLSANGINGHIGSEREESCNGSKTQSATTTESNTPENTVRLEHAMEMQNSRLAASQRYQNIQFLENGEVILENNLKESDIIQAAIVLNHETSMEVIQHTLCDLAACIKYGNCELPNKHFKGIIKMLLSLLESPNSDIMIAALRVLAKILRSEKMKPYWNNFLELILLKIIDCYKQNKEAVKDIDNLLPRIASILPVNATINILNTVIATGVYPMNLCAVKLLNDLAEKQGEQFTENHLESVMPNLARLADDSVSVVRKAAVFCIVKLYIVMGEEKVKPKLSILNASKIRLLNVYIEKAKSSKS
ncbi:CLIP-associating protein isoform X3 [Condylostylus longicornis]|uniref:CLIP-associating protein isoform X3 n=1 Tax=Condylostylus longicornis TaxID=2530218 RepID=UPI00244DFA4D|nr:CLIP-associating protein isoform X3 [Condylostylus longicornis]